MIFLKKTFFNTLYISPKCRMKHLTQRKHRKRGLSARKNYIFLSLVTPNLAIYLLLLDLVNKFVTYSISYVKALIS